METGAAQYFDEAARWLKAEKVHVEPGLTDTEVDAIEERYEFRFPPDLRMFLQTVVPISAPKSKRVWFYMSRMKPRRGRMRPIAWSLPNWRKRNQELDDMVTKSFDLATWYGDQQIERGQWDERWGIKPYDLQEAKRQMVESVRRAPKTIPLSNAFYMSADPSEPGNPIWEYFIEDLQYYAGFDLPGFLHNRYGVPLPSWAAVVPRWIDFWSEEVHMSPERTSGKHMTVSCGTSLTTPTRQQPASGSSEVNPMAGFPRATSLRSGRIGMGTSPPSTSKKGRPAMAFDPITSPTRPWSIEAAASDSRAKVWREASSDSAGESSLSATSRRGASCSVR
jgi:hypothetical protein